MATKELSELINNKDESSKIKELETINLINKENLTTSKLNVKNIKVDDNVIVQKNINIYEDCNIKKNLLANNIISNNNLNVNNNTILNDTHINGELTVTNKMNCQNINSLPLTARNI